MKRFFPRALPEAIGFCGLVVVGLSGGCSVDHEVKPGAPVLTQLTIVENGGTPTNIKSDTPMCETGTSTDAGTDATADASPDATADGGTDATGDASPDAGTDATADANDDAGTDATANASTDAAPAARSVPDEPAASGAACDPAKHDVCKKGAADWCRCLADPADMSKKKGLWNCDPFAPLSVVVATFDRLLDTDPIDPGDAGQTSRDDIAMLMVMPTPAKPVSTATDYSSTGSPSGSVFNALGPAFFNNFRSGGPSLQVAGAPALPTDSQVTITLDPAKIMAKDGKTRFAATGMLATGSLTFTTAAFQASVEVPTAPPPPPPTPTDGGDDAADAGSDAASDGGASDGGTGDAATSDAGTDIKVDATADAGVSDAGVSDAGVSDAGSDASAATPPATGDPVPADMSMGAVTITFTNLVGEDVLSHIKVTEDGKPFTAYVTSDKFPAPDTKTFPMSKVALKPKTMWAAGKTYVITVDADAADVVGDKLGMSAAAAFMMGN